MKKGKSKLTKEIQGLNYNELVYWLGNLDLKHSKAQEYIQGALLNDFFLCFLSEDQTRNTDLNFLNDYSED